MEDPAPAETPSSPADASPLISPTQALQRHHAGAHIWEIDWFSSYQPSNHALLTAAFAQGHIPAAVLVSIQDDLSEPRASTVSEVHPEGIPFTRIASPSLLRERLGRLGLKSFDDEVVIYARAAPVLSSRVVGMMGATRAWWVLSSWGLKNVTVMDGGFESWVSDGLAIEEGPSNRPAGTCFNVSGLVDGSASWRASSDQVCSAIQEDEGDVLVVDTLQGWPNTATRYGKALGPERMGHIAEAINAPAAGLLDANGRFLRPEAIKAYFEANQVDLSAPVIVY
eukprot:TRINITY_DN6440_c0_g1_i2.p1 TRINITY_DN6440_c0_g1~~TRINITY_DN6440_c0_g1_i2.p1  ORF type:complete len:282 (-),score=60.22 TRINITY_DN6440_c0_g1_i2:470-1315(-)